MVRVRAPTSVIRPSASWRITTRLASHARRCDVSAENIRAALEHGLARRLGVYQHRGVDVDHDLIALAWSPRIDSPVEGCLGDQRERVRLLLLYGGCFWGTIHVLRSRGTAHGVRPPWPFMSRCQGRCQFLNHYRDG